MQAVSHQATRVREEMLQPQYGHPGYELRDDSELGDDRPHSSRFGSLIRPGGPGSYDTSAAWDQTTDSSSSSNGTTLYSTAAPPSYSSYTPKYDGSIYGKCEDKIASVLTSDQATRHARKLIAESNSGIDGLFDHLHIAPPSRNVGHMNPQDLAIPVFAATTAPKWNLIEGEFLATNRIISPPPFHLFSPDSPKLTVARQ